MQVFFFGCQNYKFTVRYENADRKLRIKILLKYIPGGISLVFTFLAS